MKALFVGLGGIGQRHLRNLRTLCSNDLEVSAYRTRGSRAVLTDQLQLEPNADLQERYGLRVHASLDAALEQKPDVVFVCNPSSLHIQVAIAAACAGCHLYIEKPLSHTLDGVDDLERFVAERRLVALVGYQLRFHPCLRRLRERLLEGAIGRPVAVRAHVGEFLPGWHTYEDYRHVYASRRDLGGGVILSQIHELDYLYWLFGVPHRVFALGGHLSRLEVDVEDTVSMLFEAVVDGRAIPIHVHADYLQRPASRGCEIIGDAGKIVLDFAALRVRVFNGAGDLVEDFHPPVFERNQMFLDAVAHFLDCVRGVATPLVSVRDAVHSLRMALAAKTSLETGAVETIA